MEQPKYPVQYLPPGFVPEYMPAPPPMVVTTQPTMGIMPQPVHKDYLPWSIVNMIFCCLPLGIAALIFSIKTRDAVQRHDFQTASMRSRSAFSCNVTATVIGLGVNAAWIGYVIFFSAAQGIGYKYYSG